MSFEVPQRRELLHNALPLLAPGFAHGDGLKFIHKNMHGQCRLTKCDPAYGLRMKFAGCVVAKRMAFKPFRRAKSGANKSAQRKKKRNSSRLQNRDFAIWAKIRHDVGLAFDFLEWASYQVCLERILANCELRANLELNVNESETDVARQLTMMWQCETNYKDQDDGK